MQYLIVIVSYYNHMYIYTYVNAHMASCMGIIRVFWVNDNALTNSDARWRYPRCSACSGRDVAPSYLAEKISVMSAVLCDV